MRTIGLLVVRITGLQRGPYLVERIDPGGKSRRAEPTVRQPAWLPSDHSARNRARTRRKGRWGGYRPLLKTRQSLEGGFR